MSYTPHTYTSSAHLLLLYIDPDVSPCHPLILLLCLKLLIQPHHAWVRQVKLVEGLLGRLVRPPRIGPLGEVIPVVAWTMAASLARVCMSIVNLLVVAVVVALVLPLPSFCLCECFAR